MMLSAQGNGDDLRQRIWKWHVAQYAVLAALLGDREEQDVVIRLYRFKGKDRWRWAARLGAVEGYGALPSEALKALADGLNADDEARLLAEATGA